MAGRFLYADVVAYDDKYTISSSLTTGECTVTVNEPIGNPTYLKKGTGVDFQKPFNEVYVRNVAQSGAMLRIYSSSETRISPFSSEISVVGNTASNTVDLVDISILTTATTLVLSTNQNRKSAIIRNNASNGTTVRVGGATTDATHGVELNSGDAYIHDSKDALYVYNPSGSTITISRTEETV